MKSLSASILLLAGLSSPFAVGQRPTVRTLSETMETTVCRVFDEPSGYNNTLVKVRGYVKVSFEYALLMDEQCPEKAIWFAFGDGSVPPQVGAYVNGRGRVGGMDSEGRRTLPLAITLVKDKNFVELTRYLELSAKGEACADRPPTESLPDCTTYRVTATFSGRIDGVSKQLHAAHVKRSSVDTPDGKGFGHMGMFDAQIVVQSVKNVIAVDETKLRDATAKPQK
jgi:hypothetical protein